MGSLHEKLQNIEQLLAGPNLQMLTATLKPLVERASLNDIKREVAMLLAAFPTRDDLSAFVGIVVEELAGEQPSKLELMLTCRQDV